MSRPTSPPVTSASPSQTPPAASLSPPAIPSTIIGPYTIGHTIGAGIFAEVKLGSDEYRQHVAIKIFNKSALASPAANAGGSASTNGGKQPSGTTHAPSHQSLQIEKEINSLRVCSHPHIVQFYDVLETESKVYLVMEHLPYGELYDFILDKGKLPEAEAGRLFSQVTSAIDYCHAHGIVHRDLKPENILLTSDGNIKVVDFGLANYWNTKEDSTLRSLRTQCGSPHYAAPEILEGKKYSGTLADIWSLGVLLYAMLCGSLPFNAKSIPMLIKKIVEGRFKLPKFLSPQAQHLLQTILQIVPENRPSLKQVMEHPWMQMYGQAELLQPYVDAAQAAEQAKNGATNGSNGSSTSGAPTSRPISRPEIIAPQSYTNARASLLLAQKGYRTVNANKGIMDSNGGIMEEQDEEDAFAGEEDQVEEELNTFSNPDAVYALDNGNVANGVGASLPPSSVLTFQPDSQWLNDDVTQDYSDPNTAPKKKPVQSALTNGGANSPASNAANKPKKSVLIQCPGCGKQLPRLRSPSTAKGQAPVTPQNKEDLCQCRSATSKSIHTSTNTQTSTPAAATPATAASSTSPGTSVTGSPSTQPLRKKPSAAEAAAAQAAHDAWFSSRCDLLFKAAEKGDVEAVKSLIIVEEVEKEKEKDVSQTGKEVSTTQNSTTQSQSSSSAASSSSNSSSSNTSSSSPQLALDVRVTNKDGWNALHFASRYGHIDLVQFLLTCWHPLDINSRTQTGWTPLMLCTQQGHLHIITLLLRYGAAIHVVNNDGKSAIFIARECGFSNIAMLLTNTSSQRHLKHSNTINAAASASGAGGINGEQQVKELNHEFFRACECGDLGKVRHLLQLGRGDIPVVQTSSRRQATASPPVDGSATADAAAAVVPRYCVNILARGIDNWSCLHFAARKGRTAIVELLLAHEPPADVNTTTKNGWTPLMLAADRGHAEVCQTLLKGGAEYQCKSNDGYTALSAAQEGNHTDVVNLLQKYITALNTPPVPTPNGRVPNAPFVFR